MTTVPPMPDIVRQAISEVAARHGRTFEEIVTRVRPRTTKWRDARFEAVAAVRALTKPDGKPRFSMPKIAGFFGYLDHTSVVHALAVHRATRAAETLQEAA